MKKIVSIVSLISIFALSTNAQVNSRNAAGYVKRDGHLGAFHLISLPFNNFDGSGIMLPTDVFGANTPVTVGSSIYVFDSVNQVYTSGETLLAEPVGWQPNTTNLEGEAFWLYLADDGGTSPINLYLYGEVPDTVTAPTSSSVITGSGDPTVKSFNLINYAYPAEILWTDTSLSQASAVGDTIYKFDPINGYNESSTLFPFGWFPDNLVLKPGDSFWFATSNSLTWNENKPYVFP